MAALSFHKSLDGCFSPAGGRGGVGVRGAGGGGWGGGGLPYTAFSVTLAHRAKAAYSTINRWPANGRLDQR